MSLYPPENSGKEEYNPFAAPSTFDFAMGGTADQQAEFIRHELLKHEASIKSIGLLYMIGSILLVMIGAAAFIPAIDALQRNAVDAQLGVLIASLLLGFGVLQGFIAVGLRRLRGWVKIPVGVISGLGLLSFPIGTLINGYILYLIFSERGSRVFSPEYQEIIRQTPHIQYRTSIIVKVLGLLLLGFLGLGAIVVLVRG